MTSLPKEVKREPLLEAMFEVRLQDDPSSLADLLPGILFEKLEPKPTIRRLPAAELPQPVRANEPTLRFALIQNLDWKGYSVAIGDQNVVVSCKPPCPEWEYFKGTILKIVNLIREAGVGGSVERFSIKYVDLIEGNTLADQLGKIDLHVRIGSQDVSDCHFNVQVHHAEEDTSHICTATTGAIVTSPGGKESSGVVVSIDSIRQVEPQEFANFAAGLEPELERLRKSNKMRFFNFLKQDTINEMEPIYE